MILNLLHLLMFFGVLILFFFKKSPAGLSERDRQQILRNYRTNSIKPMASYISIYGIWTFAYNAFLHIYDILYLMGYKVCFFVHFVHFIFLFWIVQHDARMLSLSYLETIDWILWFWMYDIGNDFPISCRRRLLSVVLYDFLNRLLNDGIFIIHTPIFLQKCKNRLQNMYRRFFQECKKILHSCKNSLQNMYRHFFFQECRICYNYVGKLQVTACGHCFCQSCLTKMHICPYCNSLIDTVQIVSSIKEALKIGRKVYRNE
jgi:hypothetical protein